MGSQDRQKMNKSYIFCANIHKHPTLTNQKRFGIRHGYGVGRGWGGVLLGFAMDIHNLSIVLLAHAEFNAYLPTLNPVAVFAKMHAS